jgi:transposase
LHIFKRFTMLFSNGDKLMSIKSWEVSDGFWSIVEPLIPSPKRAKEREYKRRVGGGRKPIEPRKVFAAIVYVLRTGIQWKALPKEIFGSPSAIHRYFREWEQRGFFFELWQRGLSEYDDMEGIAWEWQSIDGCMNKAPLAQESSGANPTDRGKKRNKTPYSCGRAWRPVVHRRDRSQQA